MKKITLLLLFIFSSLIIGLQFIFPEKATNTSATIKPLTATEVKGLHFLQTKLQSPQGLIYYLAEHKSAASYSVSESMGQAMEYAALIGDKNLFENYAKITDKYFRDPTGYFYWKIDVATKKGEPASALVDDLRLIKAYFIANEHNMGNYDEQIKNLSEIVYKFDIDTNGYPCDYYDGEGKQKARVVSLFYLDVETLEKLSKFNNKWSTPYQKAKEILLTMPENRYGFYPQTFAINTNQYLWPATINMVENLYTAMDAHQAGKNTRPFATFLKKQVKKGKIYNYYHVDGTSADKDESTAVYALAARFLALNNEMEAADWCYRRTLEFQMGDAKAFAGGFGEQDTGLVYAFDQLEALLMLRMVDVRNVSQ